MALTIYQYQDDPQHKLEYGLPNARVRLAEKDLSRAGRLSSEENNGVTIAQFFLTRRSRYTNIKMTQHRLEARLAITLQE